MLALMVIMYLLIFLESLPSDNLWENVRIYGNFNATVHNDVDSFFTINPELNEYHQSNTTWGPIDNVTSEFEFQYRAWLEDISCWNGTKRRVLLKVNIMQYNIMAMDQLLKHFTLLQLILLVSSVIRVWQVFWHK